MIPLCIAGFYGGLWILYCFLGILIASGLIYFDLFIIMMAVTKEHWYWTC